jgi:hypothetical protein
MHACRTVQANKGPELYVCGFLGCYFSSSILHFSSSILLGFAALLGPDEAEA